MFLELVLEIGLLRAKAIVFLAGLIGSPSIAQDINFSTWIEHLEEARECVAQSEPDFERAIWCYEAALETEFFNCVKKTDPKPCLEDTIGELRKLLPLYNSHKWAQEAALQYDPSRCHGLIAEEGGLPKDVSFLYCQFTALSTQVTLGHVVSIWGELHFQD